MSSINLSYSKEFQILLTSSKMACSDKMHSQTVFQRITWNSDKCPRPRKDILQMYLHITGWLPTLLM